MAKAILIVDTDDCAGCPAAIYDEIDDISMCQAMGLKDIPDYFSKPDWCPLIVLNGEEEIKSRNLLNAIELEGKQQKVRKEK